MAESSNNPSSGEPVSFEKALSSLEQIVHDLEEGKLGLTESLGRYEEGVKLLKQCYTMLEQAERRIELLSGVDAAGNPIAEPFDHEATLAVDKEGLPRSRRGGKSKKQRPADAESSSEPSTPAMDEPGSLF